MSGEPRDLMAALRASIDDARESRPRIWTVEAFSSDHPAMGWTKWTEWVDRATAEDEKANALELGYRARIVRAS